MHGHERHVSSAWQLACPWLSVISPKFAAPRAVQTPRLRASTSHEHVVKEQQVVRGRTREERSTSRTSSKHPSKTSARRTIQRPSTHENGTGHAASAQVRVGAGYASSPQLAGLPPEWLTLAALEDLYEKQQTAVR